MSRFSAIVFGLPKDLTNFIPNEEEELHEKLYEEFEGGCFENESQSRWFGVLIAALGDYTQAQYGWPEEHFDLTNVLSSPEYKAAKQEWERFRAFCKTAGFVIPEGTLFFAEGWR